MPDDESPTRPVLTPERWREIGALVDGALELPPERRAEYLETACADPRLRAEVERLIASCEKSGEFLERSAGELAAPLFASQRKWELEDMLPQLRSGLAGRFEVERELGHGASAIVYLARDVRHGRRVAIKVLRAELAAALGAGRFLREIETLARLTHPHIVPLLESGEIEGRPYYIMPHVEGESLRARLVREQQLPVEEAVRIARDVAGALGYAHRQNVLHRDLKPENILFSDEQAVVTDFGIARAIVRAVSAERGEQTAETLTATGFSLGTPAYMSPEQAAGDRTIDARSDVYALGCMLYEMLGGRPPFTGPTVESVIRQHLLTPPTDLSVLRDDVAPGVAKAVMRALAKTRSERFASMEEFARGLAGTMEEPSRNVASFLSARVRHRSMALVGVAGLVALAGWAVLKWVDSAERSDLAGEIVQQAQQLTFDPELELDPALSADGRLLAYAAGPVHQTHIYVRQLSGGRPVLLSDTLTGALRWPRWSPDGTRISFHSHDGIYVVPALGGRIQRIVESPHARLGMPVHHSAVWTPDGTQLTYVENSVIWSVRISDGVRRRLASGFRLSGLAWSPDGSRLAYTSGNAHFTFAGLFIGNVASAVVFIVDSSGGTPLPVTDARFFATSPAWTADGRRLLFISSLGGARDIFRVEIGQDGAVRNPERVTTGLQAHSMSIDQAGRTIAVATFAKVSNIHAVDIDSTRAAALADARPITRDAQTIEGLGISPSGRWLTFDSNLGGSQDIYRIPTAGGEAERLTTSPGDEFAPSWSPDESEIVFQLVENGDRDLSVMRADGSAIRRITKGATQDFYPHWSPDGRAIVYNSFPRGGVRIAQRASTGEFANSVILTPRGGRPRWSPTGEWIAFIVDDSVHVMDPGGNNHRVVDMGDSTVLRTRWVEWSKDGKQLYAQTLDVDGGWSIRRVPLADGLARVLFRVDASVPPFSDAFATDDRRLYFPITEFTADLWLLTLRKP